MLDILRRHASSWLIKVILGAIVITFVFFFGYSTLRRGPRSGGEAVATVNGRPIPASEYRFLLDQSYDKLRTSFKGQEIPEFVQKMAASTTLNQLVSRELALAQAEKLGVIVPVAELAAAVKQTPAAQRGGEFDAVFYKTQFLPYFKGRFGIEYEQYLDQDLKIGALDGMFRGVGGKPPFPGGPEGGDMKWTFEMVSLDPAELTDSLGTIEEVRKLASVLISQDPKRWKGMLAPFNVKPTKAGPIRLRNRGSLLEGQATFEDQRAILTLTEEDAVIDEPIERGGKIYVVRLVERVDEEGAPSWPTRDFFNDWMSKLREKAEVVSFLETDQ